MKSSIRPAQQFYDGLAKAVAQAKVTPSEVEQIQTLLDGMGPEHEARITDDVLVRAGIPPKLRAHVVLQLLQRRFPQLNLADVANTASEAIGKIADLGKLSESEDYGSKERLDQLLTFHSDITAGPPYPKADRGDAASRLRRNIEDPQIGSLAAFKEDQTQLMIGSSIYHGEVHPYEAVTIVEQPSGGFQIKGYGLDEVPMAELDHGTLGELERIAEGALAKARAPGSGDDGGGAAFIDRFLRTVRAHESEVEARFQRLGLETEVALSALRGAVIKAPKNEVDDLVESLPPPPASAGGDPNVQPKSTDHEWLIGTLSRYDDPVVGRHSAFLESGGTCVRVGSELDSNGDPHGYRAFDIRREDGKVMIDLPRRSALALEDLDHGTLTKLEGIVEALLAKTIPPEDPSIGVGTPRVGTHDFLSAVAGDIRRLKSAFESGPEAEALQAFVTEGVDLNLEVLRALLRRGLGAEDVAKVRLELRSLSNRDPEAFAHNIQDAIAAKEPKSARITAADVRKLAEERAGCGNAYEEAGAQVALALLSKDDGAKQKVVADAEKFAQMDRVPIIVSGLVAQAIAGDADKRSQIFTKGIQWADSSYRYKIIGGLSLMAAGANSSAERKIAYSQAREWSKSDYLDLGGESPVRAAVAATPAQRKKLFAKAKKDLESNYYKIYAGALVTMALTAEGMAERREVFELGQEMVQKSTIYDSEAGVLAMALCAEGPAEKQEALRVAQSIATGDYKPVVKIPALIAMGMLACDDPEKARLAAAATVDW